MKQQTLERLILGYQASVHHPEVSGMEHLQLLQIRSKLADWMQELSATQQERIKQADLVLLANANAFLRAIDEIADLNAWRIQGNAPPEHWWWYLDVIVHVPAIFTIEAIQANASKPVLV